MADEREMIDELSEYVPLGARKRAKQLVKDLMAMARKEGKEAVFDGWPTSTAVLAKDPDGTALAAELQGGTIRIWRTRKADRELVCEFPAAKVAALAALS